jgi:hypothetical protein
MLRRQHIYTQSEAFAFVNSAMSARLSMKCSYESRSPCTLDGACVLLIFLGRRIETCTHKSVFKRELQFQLQPQLPDSRQRSARRSEIEQSTRHLRQGPGRGPCTPQPVRMQLFLLLACLRLNCEPIEFRAWAWIRPRDDGVSMMMDRKRGASRCRVSVGG